MSSKPIRYKIYDHFLNAYLDPERNYAELREDKWFIHMENTAGLTGELILVAYYDEGEEDMGKVFFKEGHTEVEVALENFEREGVWGGTLLAALLNLLEAKLPSVINTVFTLLRYLLPLIGSEIGRQCFRWKIKYPFTLKIQQLKWKIGLPCRTFRLRFKPKLKKRLGNLKAFKGSF